MVRQSQHDEAMQTIAVRVPTSMLADIDAYRARLKAQNPAFRVERGEAMRDLLLKALAMVGDSGPIEAPVTLEADHADHDDRKAAVSQDHERTTVRTGRKRTTVRTGRKRTTAAAKG